MKNLILLASLVFMTFACSSKPKEKEINSKDFPNWPFIQDKYALGCLKKYDRPLVYIKNLSGTQFGINGAARGVGARDLGWSDGESQLLPNELPISLQPFIDEGLKICNQK